MKKGKRKTVRKKKKKKNEPQLVQEGADELKRKCDEWLARLAAVEERERALKQRGMEKQNYPKFWWEMEELSHEETKLRDELFMDLHRKILNAAKEKTTGASSSSAKADSSE